MRRITLLSSKVRRILIVCWPYIALILIEILLIAVNYKKGSYLVGWDNLFPEFNNPVNLNRTLHAVWQEYRGMGVVDSMSHASTLVEDVERLLLSLVFPTALVRWIYMFSLHLIGGLGVLHLVRMWFRKAFTTTSHSIIDITALLSAFFYQYNLGTIQQFYLPMEVFIVHFAYLPWLLWAVQKVLHKPTLKNSVILGILSFLATPQAHVPTLFIVYGMAVGIVCLVHLAAQKRKALLPIFIVAFILFVTNAFWIIPFGYATISHSKEVADSKAFQMASNDIFYRNHQYGNIKDVALMNSSLLDYNHFDVENNRDAYMFQPWLRHTRTPLFQLVAWVFFGLAVWGCIQAGIKKDVLGITFALLFCFAILMLGTDIPILGNISFFIREYVPLFKTVFRAVFTKFSILYGLAFSIMLGYGVLSILKNIQKKWITITIITFVTLGMLWYAAPAFQKSFFYKNLRVDIPKEYTDTFAFLQKQNPAERVAMLPIPWYWAWLQSDWGTINSGFMWYAIPQPSTDLAFTPWSDANENFYWELDRGLILQDILQVERVMEKYDIRWIYLDRNIMNGQSRKLTYHSLDEFLLSSTSIRKAKEFEQIVIYSFSESKKLTSFVGIQNASPRIYYEETSNDLDYMYERYGSYVQETKASDADIIVPFSSLFSGKTPILNNFTVAENAQSIRIQSSLSFDAQLLSKLQLIQLPESEENYITDTDGNVKQAFSSLDLNEKQGRTTIGYMIDKKSSQIYDSDTDIWYTDQSNIACPTEENGASMQKSVENGKTIFRLTSKNSDNCIRAALPSLVHRYGYLVRVEYEADTQRGWFMNIFNTTTNKTVLETYLRQNGKKNTDYYVLTPGEEHGMGYTIYLNNKSEGVEKVTNAVINISVYQIPYNKMKQLAFVWKGYAQGTNGSTKVASVVHPNPSFYKVELTSDQEAKADNLLYLSQAYEEGWIGLQVQSTQLIIGNYQLRIPKIFLLPHVRVNGWANAWLLEEQPTVVSRQSTDNMTKTILLLFWPQYLEYGGFFILALTMGILGVKTVVGRKITT